MNSRDIYEALDRRDPAALADAMTPRSRTDCPLNALRVTLCEFSVADLKRLLQWAEDWLSNPRQLSGRPPGAPTTCMRAVYKEIRFILQQSGAIDAPLH